MRELKELKYYDSNNDRLVCVEKEASSDFWDNHWKADQLKRDIVQGARNRLVMGITKKFLPAGSRVLEGGAGIGQNVFGLQKAGYESIGIDYAPETVKKVKEAMPEIDLRLGDVRQLPFENDYFDGYWSLGVIEHFYEGYEPLATEMKRVIKKGGYLFLTFPYVSSFRRGKIKMGLYPSWNEQLKNNFYQFVLNPASVGKYFQSLGFSEVYKRPYDGIKGLKDEVSVVQKALQPLYDAKSLPTRILRHVVNKTLEPASGHMLLLVLQKQ